MPTPEVVLQPNGRCCIILNEADQQIAKCVVPGLAIASIRAAQQGADEQANAKHYTGHRTYDATAVHI